MSKWIRAIKAILNLRKAQRKNRLGEGRIGADEPVNVSGERARSGLRHRKRRRRRRGPAIPQGTAGNPQRYSTTARYSFSGKPSPHREREPKEKGSLLFGSSSTRCGRPPAQMAPEADRAFLPTRPKLVAGPGSFSNHHPGRCFCVQDDVGRVVEMKCDRCCYRMAVSLHFDEETKITGLSKEHLARKCVKLLI